MHEPQVCLRVDNVTWLKKSTPILQKISLKIARNSCFGILGPNGSGKTSLLRCLYRGIQPTSGSIFLDGRVYADIKRAEFARSVAVVLQENDADISLRVSEILRLGRLASQRFLERDSHIFTDHEQTIIHTLELENLLNRNFVTLSGGEKQRAMIARALIQKAKIIMLDEPTNHLDIAHQIRLLRYLSDLDVTVICSLHDLNLAAQFCDEVAVMSDGVLVAQGQPSSILDPKLIRDVFFAQAVTDIHPKSGSYRVSFY